MEDFLVVTRSLKREDYIDITGNLFVESDLILTETFIKNNSQYKIQKVSKWVLWVGDARNIHNSFFIKNHYVLELEVVFSGSFKCYKVFSLKIKNESPKRCEPLEKL